MPDKIVNHFVLANGSIAKYSAEQLAGDVPEVVGIRTGFDGTVYDSAGDAVRGQSVDSILDYAVQFIDYSKIMSNTRYSAVDDEIVHNVSGYTAFPVFIIPKGTYYYKNIFPNFTHYSTDNNTFSTFSSRNGTISFDESTYLYVTGNASYGEPVISNSEIFPATSTYGKYNIKLDGSLIEVDKTLKVAGKPADAEETGKMFGVRGWQYLNDSDFTANTRFDTSSTTRYTASGYFTAIASCPAGIYYFRNVSTDFTQIEKNSDKSLTQFSTLVGGGTKSGSITIDYDFTVYLTANYSFDTNAYGNVIWSNIPYHFAKRVYGQIGVRADSRRYSEIVKPVFEVYKDGTGDFTTLKEAVETAVQYPNAVVKVHAGTYDLVEEYGQDVLDGTSSIYGLWLYNDIHVIFDSNAKVVCNYTGNNAFINEHFSPFGALKRIYALGGYCLENLSLECSNVRYGIHDEADAYDYPYKNEYKLCSITIDNRNNQHWNSRQCIGGGLGSAGEIIVDGCYFESKTDGDTGTGIVSYHNGQSGRSNIVIKDCYFAGKDTVKASWHGASTEVTRVMVTGCSLGSEPYNMAESSSDTIENVELISFNNTIRN